VINQAVAEAQTAHARATSGHRDQLTAVTKELKEAMAAIDRYLSAFEKGTLDDEDEHVQARLATLKEQTRRLRARKAQLEFELEQPPTPPTPAQLAKISDRIREVLMHGTPTAKKALFEALIEQIEVESDDRLIPCPVPKFRQRGRELPFRHCGQAARSYSLIAPPRTRRRRTLALIATTTSGSWSGGC
jgi:site-specific DNA recombinase